MEDKLLALCPTCKKEIKSSKPEEWTYISVGVACVSYTGYICKECSEKVTLGELVKSQL